MTKWGEEQAERYTSGLFDKFEAILHHVVLWRPIAPQYNVSGYVTRYEKHFIYWRQFSDGQIGIAAILHKSMLKTDRLAAGFEEF